MVNSILVTALFAVATAAPQSYIVGPGHFHYEFGGENEFKYSTPAPAVKAAPVSTVAPIVSSVVSSVAPPVVTPVVKKIEYQVKPISYSTPVTVRPVTQQVTVSQYPSQSYVSQYPTQSYISQYPSQSYVSQYPTQTYVSQYSSQNNDNSYGNQRYVSQSVGVNIPQYNKVTTTVPVANVRTQSITPVVTVQNSQPITQAYASQVQSGHNYGGYAILRYVVDIQPQGSYHYDYETENGIKAEERGELKNAGTQDEAEIAQGYYSYTGPDGVVYTVRYIADENGFRAEGDHLPKIPEAIQRALEYLKTLPPQPDEQKK